MSSIKPLPTDLRDHLAEISGNEMKVWMAYYLRTGGYDLTSYPDNETIERDTGICNDTVKTCKASLRAKGWLNYTGDYKQPRQPGGKFAVPVMEVRLPWRPDWSMVVTDVSMAYEAITVVEKTTHGTVVENFHPEGSCSGSGFDSRSSSCSAAWTLSDSNKGSLPNSVPQSKEVIKAEPKPEPEATPAPARTHGHGRGRYAPDGTPFPEDFDSWPKNAHRLNWLVAHGWNQTNPDGQKALPDPMAELKDWLPVLRPPGSGAPPKCPECGKTTEIVSNGGQWQCQTCDEWGPMLDSASLDNFDVL